MVNYACSLVSALVSLGHNQCFCLAEMPKLPIIYMQQITLLQAKQPFYYGLLAVLKK